MNISESMRAAIEIAEKLVRYCYPGRHKAGFHFEIEARDARCLGTASFRDIKVVVKLSDEPMVVMDIRLIKRQEYRGWSSGIVDLHVIGNVYRSFHYWAERNEQWSLRELARVAHTDREGGLMMWDTGFWVDGLPTSMKRAAPSS